MLVWVREIPHAPAFPMGDCTLNRVKVQNSYFAIGTRLFESSEQTFIGPVFI
jgi:hypothetical protein